MHSPKTNQINSKSNHKYCEQTQEWYRKYKNKTDESRTDCDEDHTVEENDQVTVPLQYRGTFTHDMTFE